MKSSMKKLLKLAEHAPPYLSSVVSSVKLCSYYRKDFQQNLIVIQSHLCPPFSVLGNPIDFLFFCHLIIDFGFFVHLFVIDLVINLVLLLPSVLLYSTLYYMSTFYAFLTLTDTLIL